MPSALLHLALGQRCLRQGDWSPGEHAAAFALGAIAPDGPRLRGASRSASHFWDSGDDTSGVIKLVGRHPRLLAQAAQSAPLQAYLLGYVCHLVADEQWIFTIYRKYFGRHSPYGGGPEGAALQYAFHAQLEASPLFTADIAAGARWLDPAQPAPDLPWAASTDVAKWAQLVAETVPLKPGLPHFRHVLAGGHRLSEAEQHDWLTRYPQRTRTVATYVDDADVQTFANRATAAGIEAVGTVLGRMQGLSPHALAPAAVTEGLTRLG